MLDTIEAVLRAKLKSEAGEDRPGEAAHPGWDEAAEARSAASVTGTRSTLHVFFYKWLEEKYGVRATVLLVRGTKSASIPPVGVSAIMQNRCYCLRTAWTN